MVGQGQQQGVAIQYDGVIGTTAVFRIRIQTFFLIPGPDPNPDCSWSRIQSGSGSRPRFFYDKEKMFFIKAVVHVFLNPLQPNKRTLQTWNFFFFWGGRGGEQFFPAKIQILRPICIWMQSGSGSKVLVVATIRYFLVKVQTPWGLIMVIKHLTTTKRQLKLKRSKNDRS